MTSMKSALPDVDFSSDYVKTLMLMLRGGTVELEHARLALMVMAMHVRHRIEELQYEERTGIALTRDPSQWQAVVLDDGHA